jgi:hypothetical protein
MTTGSEGQLSDSGPDQPAGDAIPSDGALSNDSSDDEGFVYAPHPHIEARRVLGPPTVKAAREALHGPGWFARFNAKVGLKITIIVGTMWAAYLFTLLALISAPAAFTSGDPLIIVAWIAQTFLQLVLLPIIIVGQNVQAKAADARAEATYNDAAAVLEEAKQIQIHLASQDAQLVSLLSQMESLIGPATVT